MDMGHDTIWFMAIINQKIMIWIYMIMKTSDHMCGFHLLVAINSQSFPWSVYLLQSMNHHLRIFTGIMSQLYWNFCTLNYPLLKSSWYNLRCENFYIQTLWCIILTCVKQKRHIHIFSLVNFLTFPYLYFELFWKYCFWVLFILLLFNSNVCCHYAKLYSCWFWIRILGFSQQKNSLPSRTLYSGTSADVSFMCCAHVVWTSCL